MSKNTKIILGIIIAVVVIGGIWLGVNKKNDSVMEGKEKIKIGAIYQLSGVGADWGKQAEKGLRIAEEEINASGGINGRYIEIIYEDSKSNPTDALTAMNKLVNINGVKAVLSQQSSIVVSLSSMANNNKIILIDTGATTPAYISPNDFTFRVSYSASYFAKGICDFLNKNNVKSIGFLYANNDYGVGMLKFYKKYFNGEIIITESIQENDTDFRSQIQKLKNSNPDAIVYTLGGPKQGGILLKQIKESGMDKPLYTDFYSIEYPVILETAGQTAEGVIYASQEYDTNRTDLVFKNFNKKFIEKYDEISNPLSAQAYDGLKILAFVMDSCKNNPTNSECLKQNFYEIQDFVGVIGLVNFDENGEVKERPIVLKTVKNGEFVLYEEN